MVTVQLHACLSTSHASKEKNTVSNCLFRDNLQQKNKTVQRSFTTGALSEKYPKNVLLCVGNIHQRIGFNTQRFILTDTVFKLWSYFKSHSRYQWKGKGISASTILWIFFLLRTSTKHFNIYAQVLSLYQNGRTLFQ